jgi:hypothetical protein
MTRDTEKLWAFLNTLMNLPFPLDAGDFLTEDLLPHRKRECHRVNSLVS